FAVARGLDREAFFAQPIAQCQHQAGLVFDKKNTFVHTRRSQGSGVIKSGLLHTVLVARLTFLLHVPQRLNSGFYVVLCAGSFAVRAVCSSCAASRAGKCKVKVLPRPMLDST